MAELPDTVFVRAKDICAWAGLTRHDLRKAVAAGVLHEIRWPGRKRGRYLRKEVERAVERAGRNGPD